MPRTDLRDFTITALAPNSKFQGDVVWDPTKPSPGQSVLIRCIVKNLGGDTGVQQWIRLLDVDESRVVETKYFTLGADDTRLFSFNYVMPNRSVANLRLEVGWGSIPAGLTDSRTITIGEAPPPGWPEHPWLTWGIFWWLLPWVPPIAVSSIVLAEELRKLH